MAVSGGGWSVGDLAGAAEVTLGALPEAADLILRLIRERGAKPTLAANHRAASVSASAAVRGE